MSNSEERLKRLTETDYCQADSDKYSNELIRLAEEVADAKTAKKKSRLFKALASEKRLRILKLLLVKEEMCVCELMIALDLTQPNLSHHIQILENAEILNRTKKGKWVYCSLADKKKVEKLIELGLI